MARKNRRIEQTIPKLTSTFVRYFPEGISNEPFSYIARLVEQDGEFVDIILPNRTKHTTHISNIGRA